MKKKNRTYTKEFKESILKRLEQPTTDTVMSLAKELGISKNTIYQWTRNNKERYRKQKTVSKWTSHDKFQVVLETASLTERELAEYCRRKGIYVDDIKNWKEQCLEANKSNLEDPQELKNNLKKEKDRNKKLERELRRKEKALAETAALLVLRKKADAIWGDSEEE